VLGAGTQTKSFFGEDTKVVLAVGVMGGFTTYSAFNYETLRLAMCGDLGLALLCLGCHRARLPGGRRRRVLSRPRARMMEGGPAPACRQSAGQDFAELVEHHGDPQSGRDGSEELDAIPPTGAVPGDDVRRGSFDVHGTVIGGCDASLERRFAAASTAM
jgi:hypothetical protein